MANIDNALDEYYQERFKMFEQQGWKDLVEDVKKMKQSINQLYLYNTEKDFYKAKGELSIIDWVLSLEEVSYKVYEELTHATI
jgi:hypothetical protein